MERLFATATIHGIRPGTGRWCIYIIQVHFHSVYIFCRYMLVESDTHATYLQFNGVLDKLTLLLIVVINIAQFLAFALQF